MTVAIHECTVSGQVIGSLTIRVLTDIARGELALGEAARSPDVRDVVDGLHASGLVSRERGRLELTARGRRYVSRLRDQAEVAALHGPLVSIDHARLLDVDPPPRCSQLWVLLEALVRWFR